MTLNAMLKPMFIRSFMAQTIQFIISIGEVGKPSKLALETVEATLQITAFPASNLSPKTIYPLLS